MTSQPTTGPGAQGLDADPAERADALAGNYRACFGHTARNSHTGSRPEHPGLLIDAGWPTDGYSRLIQVADHARSIDSPPLANTLASTQTTQYERRNMAALTAWGLTEHTTWDQFIPWLTLRHCATKADHLGAVMTAVFRLPISTGADAAGRSSVSRLFDLWASVVPLGPLAHAAGLSMSASTAARDAGQLTFDGLATMAALRGFRFTPHIMDLIAPGTPRVHDDD